MKFQTPSPFYPPYLSSALVFWKYYASWLTYCTDITCITTEAKRHDAVIVKALQITKCCASEQAYVYIGPTWAIYVGLPRWVSHRTVP